MVWGLPTPPPGMGTPLWVWGLLDTRGPSMVWGYPPPQASVKKVENFSTFLTNYLSKIQKWPKFEKLTKIISKKKIFKKLKKNFVNKI